MNMIHNNTVQSPRVQRNRHKRVQRILNKAMDLVITHGLDNLTMLKLAQHLDYAVGALYRYFPSKDALLASLQRNIIDLFHQRFQLLQQHISETEKNTPPAVTSLVQLLATTQLYRELSQQEPARFRLISVMLGTPQNLLNIEEGSQVMAAAMPLLQHICQLFETAASTGALKPGVAMTRTIVFWASVHSLLQLQKLSRFEVGIFQSGPLITHLQETLLQGWGADAELMSIAEKRVAKMNISHILKGIALC